MKHKDYTNKETWIIIVSVLSILLLVSVVTAKEKGFDAHIYNETSKTIEERRVQTCISDY